MILSGEARVWVPAVHYCRADRTAPRVRRIRISRVLPRSSVAPHHTPQAPTLRPFCLFPPSAAEVSRARFYSLTFDGFDSTRACVIAAHLRQRNWCHAAMELGRAASILGL